VNGPSATLSALRAQAALDARRFGVPAAMIEAATRGHLAGHWRGACAAADVDPVIDPVAVRRRYGCCPNQPGPASCGCRWRP
jgi:hypothetical protein